jgi:hypothetical protein
MADRGDRELGPGRPGSGCACLYRVRRRRVGQPRLYRGGGSTDWREVQRDGLPGAEFSWEGSDEGDQASGRGWGVLEEDGSLRGRIFFHLGDDSSFTAVRDNQPHQLGERVGGA